MKPLPQSYEHKERERHWQDQWAKGDVYSFRDDQPREQTFVIDTPPPTVSGVLHMGHIFSYTQADFVARYQRMKGKDVFYPMGFDDNGLPTERLVEKLKGVRGSNMPREEFVTLCREVVKEAEEDFRKLFRSAALSVDWQQEYQTISDEVRALSQASFVDLYQKGQIYRDFKPTYWDWVDQTAIAQAEIENRELPGIMNDIEFMIEGGQPITIATTRPELLGACVAVMYHPEDSNAAKYAGKFAITPLFGVKVPMLADDAVEREKGTGLVMCCTFGDDTDKEWWRAHGLPSRPMIDQAGRLKGFFVVYTNTSLIEFPTGKDGKRDTANLTVLNCVDIRKTIAAFESVYVEQNEATGVTQAAKIKKARDRIIERLGADGKLLKQVQITHTVKCAERSGTPIEIIPTYQWFVRIADKKEALLAKGAECNWYPDYMHIRLRQWIEGLKEDWCISRQRFFGVPLPVWYIHNPDTKKWHSFVATLPSLPTDPLTQPPVGFAYLHKTVEQGVVRYEGQAMADIKDPDGQILFKNKQKVIIQPDADVMDTWATSSISPQLSAHGINSKNAIDPDRYNKLFPADVRPQAHEIIRTWAFYTIVKAHLHENTIPWKNLMISGWCLAADKSKMSKSKGNIITPVALIEEKGSDAVRYWASTSRLGADTAFSEDLLKIGRKLVTKLWNASNFASLNLNKLEGTPTTAAQDTQSGTINETLDLWILSRLNQCVKKAIVEFEKFEYCDARVAIEDFFWKDFCDNYLELVKSRAYGEATVATAPVGQQNISNDQWSAFSVTATTATFPAAGQQSALYAIYHCLETLLRLFAPFVPHIAEELYSHIFDDRYGKAGSVHARGMWPQEADYPYDAEAERAGMACVEILNVIRKAKSEANVSIKFPVRTVEVSVKDKTVSWELLSSVLADLRAAGNAENIVSSASDSLPYTTEKSWFGVAVDIAKES